MFSSLHIDIVWYVIKRIVSLSVVVFYHVTLTILAVTVEIIRISTLFNDVLRIPTFLKIIRKHIIELLILNHKVLM